MPRERRRTGRRGGNDPIQSMTGYSRITHQASFGSIVAEARSINHRYLEISQRMPEGYVGLEGHITQLVRQTLRRGRVDLSINIQCSRERTQRLVVDEGLAQAYYDRLLDLKARFGLKGGIGLEHLLGLPRVIGVADDRVVSQTAWRPVRQAIQEALKQLLVARTQEGRRLVKDVRANAQVIRQRHSGIRKHLPRVNASQKRRVRARLRGLLGASSASTKPQIQEAVAAVRDVDIHEELVRLDSHLTHMQQLLKGTRGGVGKKLDFIAQELMREANTIGAKANDAAIARDVIEMKAAIEKIREQAQNLE